MPTTTNFGWTTPADTDLVKDGALAIRTLGNGIDTSLVDLKGGTTGQFLSKASNTDMDFTWGTVSSGMTLIASGTASAGSSIIFNNVFTSTYRNYFVTWEGTSSTAAELSFRLRASGSDNTTANYSFQFIQIINQQSFPDRVTGATRGALGTARPDLVAGQFTFYRPQLASRTLVSSFYLDNGGSNITPDLRLWHNVFNADTQFDGVTFYPGSGTFTGNIYIYGLAN